MADLIEISAWIIVIMIVFMITHLPFKGMEKTIKRDRDATIQYVAGKPMLIDKRRWDVEL